MAGNLELGGYCYWRPEGSQTGYTVHNSGTGWYNSVLADHKAYAHIKESLDAVTQWHRDTCGVVNSYDGHGGDYKVDIHAQCYGCDECADPPCPCDDEYSACGGAHGSVSFGDPTVNLGYWYGIWSSATPSGKAWAEHVMGHEFGHVLVGSGYGWKVDWPRGCVSESAADTYGVLFSVMRLGTADQWSGCGGFDTDAWRDDRAGLHPGCHSGLLKSYAYRSRFDLLRCAGEVIRHGPACLADADCPAYQSCVYFDDTGTRDCAEPAAGHWGGEIFVRLARILSEGAGVFHADGHEEDLGIPDSPLGQHTTARILSEANRSLSASADEEHWMGQILFWASVEGAYAVTSRALGAVGFFPDRISLDTRVTDRGPVKARWSDYQGSTYSKDFTAFKYGNDVLVRYLVGAGDRAELMGADTEHRPVVVGYHDFLHVFWLDKASKTIRVSILNQNGSRWYGPYIVDPGEGQLRPNGAFDATVWQDRLYLVFGDATNHDRLTLAWCYDPARCTRFNWHEFTTGVYKRQVHNMSVLAGPAAVGTAQVNGRPWDEDSLWIFFADAGTNVGALYLSRVDAADVLQSTKPVPGYYPSFKTDAPVGIAAKASAFGQTCYPEGVPTPCDRMYLYLIWRDRSGKDIYTSVFQDADAARFTRSQPAFYRANLSTGVSWTKGALPGDYLQGMYTDAKLSQPNQLHGYGRY